MIISGAYLIELRRTDMPKGVCLLQECRPSYSGLGLSWQANQGGGGAEEGRGEEAKDGEGVGAGKQDMLWFFLLLSWWGWL